ncbi:3-dehydroquinate synthase II [Methanomicrobium sp. W14]|uniref:3-dehydroquinate synthase II n=1 Tax=Methanomicrobium sp. W14 TaxID=2817839 RepID=UPI001AE6B2E9|nr:3-dehydroquinate synthase II [Methanomicrobium sp. W14]MBP2134106.1 3-dehydroquinate synthase II [Methanomicrobium sp. W14]
MKKELWVDLTDWDKDAATAAIESGADAILTDDAHRVKELGRIKTIAKNGDLVPGKDVYEVLLKDRITEDKAVSLSKKGYVIVRTTDWTVIPLENLVAQSDKIIAGVSDENEAAMAIGVLEKGVFGIVLKNKDPAVIKKVSEMVRGSGIKLQLSSFTIKSVTPAGMGDRVCVDTCSLMKDGEGMMVGNTSSSFLLVHAETLENPYVAPRPFRVNAGAVHAYALMADGKTSYLSELKAGDRVLIAGSSGNTREVTVGRVKIESRPLLLVEAESGDSRLSLVLQNAETIRLVGEDKKAVSVVDIKPGDKVLGRIESGGRHFGHSVEETILEK